MLGSRQCWSSIWLLWNFPYTVNGLISDSIPATCCVNTFISLSDLVRIAIFLISRKFMFPCWIMYRLNPPARLNKRGFTRFLLASCQTCRGSRRWSFTPFTNNGAPGGILFNLKNDHGSQFRSATRLLSGVFCLLSSFLHEIQVHVHLPDVLIRIVVIGNVTGLQSLCLCLHTLGLCASILVDIYSIWYDKHFGRSVCNNRPCGLSTFRMILGLGQVGRLKDI